MCTYLESARFFANIMSDYICGGLYMVFHVTKVVTRPLTSRELVEVGVPWLALSPCLPSLVPGVAVVSARAAVLVVLMCVVSTLTVDVLGSSGGGLALWASSVCLDSS